MKTELITTIFAAVVGVLISFFVCNLLVGQISSVSFTTIDSNVDANLSDPNPEVFNYKALNPTVEVYVGDCAEYDANGDCVQQVTEEEIIDLETTTTEEENQTQPGTGGNNQNQNNQNQNNQNNQNQINPTNQESANGSTN